MPKKERIVDTPLKTYLNYYARKNAVLHTSVANAGHMRNKKISHCNSNPAFFLFSEKERMSLLKNSYYHKNV